MKSKIEIIDETIKHIKNNGRATIEDDPDSCMYFTENGNKCAVGRCLINPENVQKKYYGASIENIFPDGNFNLLDELFKSEYRGHEIEFWRNLQLLHDIKENWDENNNLSNFGLKHYNNLIYNFNLNKGDAYG